jgi:hypothetical protein
MFKATDMAMMMEIAARGSGMPISQCTTATAPACPAIATQRVAIKVRTRTRPATRAGRCTICLASDIVNIASPVPCHRAIIAPL